MLNLINLIENMSITKMNFTLDHIVLVLNTYNIKSDITQQNDEIV